MLQVKALIDIPKTVDGKRVTPRRAGETFWVDAATARQWCDSSMVALVVEVPAFDVETTALDPVDIIETKSE
jgi:hypothetical protein